MSIRSDYLDWQQRHEHLVNGTMGRIWKNQESRYVHPFRIFGNVWYVGDDWVCVHLIDTGDGLLLIDSGNIGATAMLVQAIWEAGFNPADVRWLVLSHGHLDHIGGASFFRNMFGTRIYLGAPDAQMYREHPELSYIHDADCATETLVMPDVEIHDGDVIRFGNTPVQFYLSPGHTMGVISCFFDAHEGDRTVRCGYYGGFGFNTLQKDYLIEIGDPEYRTRQIYLNSLARTRNEKVELFLGNHTINNDTMGRRQKQLEHPDGQNPFLDSSAWGQYMDKKRDDLLAFMADPANN